MTDINWTTPVATGIAIAESQWKRELDRASETFERWKRQYPPYTESSWILYSVTQDIHLLTAKRIWIKHQRRGRKKTSYEQFLRKTKLA